MDDILEYNPQLWVSTAPKFKRICVTSDLFKIDHRQADIFPNPQRINIDWIEALVGRPIGDSLGGLETYKKYGDEGGANSPRLTFYKQCGLPFNTHSWAYVYEGGSATGWHSDLFDKWFRDDELVVSYEAPGYLIDYLNARGFSYIDFAIHPVRFLPDYMFGVRTNVEVWREKIAATSLPDEVIRDFARISAARTRRVYRKKVPPEGSALFLGQIEVDASLIHNRRLATVEDVQKAILDLSMSYPRVYYKAHPHIMKERAVKSMIRKNRNCQWLNANIYDAFGSGAFEMVGALSSSGVIEARYFGCNSRWFLDRIDYTSAETRDPRKRYYPVYQYALDSSYWRYVFDESAPTESFSPVWPCASEGALKYSVNLEWGR